MIFSFLMVAILWAGYCLGEWAGFIVAIVICIIGGMQLYKYYKEKAELQEQERIKAEKEKLAFMQLQETQRIFSDSYHIVTTTTNIDTFHGRYDLLLEKSDELQKRINALSPYNDLRKNIQKELEEVRRILPETKERVLRESTKKTFAEADALKTKNGKLNKLQKYLALLTEHEDFFSDTPTYESTCAEVQAQIAVIGSDSFSSSREKGIPFDYFEQDTLSADEEFEKIRPMLDQSAMQRSADFAARHAKQVGTINIPALEKACPLEPQPLNPSETLFLHYMDGYREGNNIAGYWTHDYHIDYQSTLEKFFSYGYMCFDDISLQLSKYKIADYKEFLSAKGMKATGKKQELIDRILENFEAGEIDEAFPRKILKVTDAGKAAIDSNDYVLYFNKNVSSFSIPLPLAEAAYIEDPQLDKYAMALKMLVDRADYNLKNRDYGLYRNDLLAQAIVYHDAGDLNTELELLFQVCFIDYYGYDNGGTQSKSDAMFAPAVLWRVKHSPVYESLGEGAEEFYFQSVRKLPSDFTQKSRPHYSFIKVAEVVAEYKDYNER